MGSRTTLSLAVSIALLLGSVSAPAAPPGAKTPTQYAVTTTIADTRNGYSLRVGSDTQGAYLHVRRTMTSVIDRFSTGTDWQMNTYYGVHLTPSNRSVFFDLTEPASPGNPIPPFATGYANTHLIAKCRLVNVDMLALATGASADCPGSFRFQASDTGQWYRFSFNPENFPEVNRLRVTCVSRDTTGCKIWTITPASSLVTGSDPNAKSLNRLLEVDDFTENYQADLGAYYLSFHITVAR